MKPILFNTEMVRANLAGRKTQTRRVIKYGESHHIIGAGVYRGLETPRYGAELETHGIVVAPYQIGDILYVRETWSLIRPSSGPTRYVYKATDSYPFGLDGYIVKFRWRPSIHMPMEAARLFLRVTDVRAERLQEIDGAGIRVEGTQGKHLGLATRGAFSDLWDSTIKPADRERYGWAANPWVWVTAFERCEKIEEECV